MKKILFCFVLLCSTLFSFAQEENDGKTYDITLANVPIDGFMGLKFGMTKAQVEQTMKYKIEKEEQDEWTYENVTLLEENYDKLSIYFNKNNKLFRGLFLKILNKKNYTLYQNTIDKFSKKYGIPMKMSYPEVCKQLQGWIDFNGNTVAIGIKKEDNQTQLLILYNYITLFKRMEEH